jgi:outer membrane protein OmpA-like peptidoglycan-associated protein
LLSCFLTAAGHAQSNDPKAPTPLGPGVNKGNVDNKSGAHYYYFYAGPGRIDFKMAFKEMGVLGAPLREALSFDLYVESGELISHNAVVSLDQMERAANHGDFGSRHKVLLRIIPPPSPLRLGGYYEFEVTGAVSFEGAQAAGAGTRPESTQLYSSGTSLYEPGTSLYAPGQVLSSVHETEQEVRLTLAADVLFDFDKADIRADAAAALEHVAAIIREKSRGTVRIEGFTDAKGSTSSNMKLSEQRASSVRKWLVERDGLTQQRFVIEGFGAARPVGPNARPDGSDDPEGRQRNRRVELIIMK